MKNGPQTSRCGQDGKTMPECPADVLRAPSRTSGGPTGEDMGLNIAWYAAMAVFGVVLAVMIWRSWR